MKRIRLSIGGYIRSDNGVRGQIVSGHRQARLLVGVGLSPGATSRSLEISFPDFHGKRAASDLRLDVGLRRPKARGVVERRFPWSNRCAGRQTNMTLQRSVQAGRVG